MYNITLPVPEKSPWDIPFPERLAALCSVMDNGYKITLYLHPFPLDAPVFRYRVYNPCQTLENSRIWRGFYFFGNELKDIRKFIDKCDNIILVRYPWDHEIFDFVQYVHRSFKQIFFDCDDLVFDVDYIRLLANTKGESLNPGKDEHLINTLFSYVSRFYALARHCDGYITTNSFLSQKFQVTFGSMAHVMRNYMNREQLEICQICREEKEKQKSISPFTIGYFSGTATHQIDILEALPHIVELMYEYPDINLRVVGFMEFPSFCWSLLNAGRIEFREPCDFRLLPAEIATVDVNVAPLVCNDFNHCKSELKFFESAVVNTPTCASPAFTFKKAIKNGETGFLCQGHEWYVALKNLYKGKYAKQGIIHSAREYCLSHYSSDEMTASLEKLMEELSK